MRFICCLIITLFVIFIYSCSKSVNNDPSVVEEPQEPQQPEQPVGEDSISYPYGLKLRRVWPKGPPRIYSNAKEIKDSMYAYSFIYDVVDSYIFDGLYRPPTGVRFISKDTAEITWPDDQIVPYGIHDSAGVFKLHSAYPMHPDYVKDSIFTDIAPDAREGRFHDIVTSYWQNNEYKIVAFIFKLNHYHHVTLDNGKDTVVINGYSYRMRNSMFKESFVSTLSSLDTLAVQEYDVTFIR